MISRQETCIILLQNLYYRLVSLSQGHYLGTETTFHEGLSHRWIFKNRN